MVERKVASVRIFLNVQPVQKTTLVFDYIRRPLVQELGELLSELVSQDLNVHNVQVLCRSLHSKLFSVFEYSE